MGRIVPTGIEEFTDLDIGNYLGNIENFEEKHSQNENLLMYSATIRILAPKERSTRFHFQNWVIGTIDDPKKQLLEDRDAEKSVTWQKKAGNLKSFCKAVGVPLEGEDMDIITRQVIRKNVCFRIEHRGSCSL